MSGQRFRRRRPLRPCPTRMAVSWLYLQFRSSPCSVPLHRNTSSLTAAKTGPSFTQQVNGFAKRFAGKLTGKVRAVQGSRDSSPSR